MEERLQKILAQAGLGSRRKCEGFIAAGRVRVNGAVAKLGDKADASKDEITMDRLPIPEIETKVYIAAYKPRKTLSDREPKNEHRPTIHDIVPNSQHLFSVGRLDYDSEGLILLTNDGELKQKLSHPRYGHEKEYKVLVASRPDDEQISIFNRGVVLEDGYKTQPAKVRVTQFHGKGAWLQVILSEGRKRQIRETCKILGLPVVRIIRVRIASLKLGGMQPKDWRFLREEEIKALKGEISNSGKKTRRIPSQKNRHSSYPPRQSKYDGKNKKRRRRPQGGKGRNRYS
jgi:23S rRNA pseudouridine2605 synthase